MFLGLITRSLSTDSKTSAINHKPQINYKPYAEPILKGEFDGLPAVLKNELMRLYALAELHGLRAEVNKQITVFARGNNDYLLNWMRRTSLAIESGTLRNSKSQTAILELMREMPEIADSVADVARRLHLVMGSKFETLNKEEIKELITKGFAKAKDGCPKEISATIIEMTLNGEFGHIDAMGSICQAVMPYLQLPFSSFPALPDPNSKLSSVESSHQATLSFSDPNYYPDPSCSLDEFLSVPFSPTTDSIPAQTDGSGRPNFKFTSFLEPTTIWIHLPVLPVEFKPTVHHSESVIFPKEITAAIDPLPAFLNSFMPLAQKMVLTADLNVHSGLLFKFIQNQFKPHNFRHLYYFSPILLNRFPDPIQRNKFETPFVPYKIFQTKNPKTFFPLLPQLLAQLRVEMVALQPNFDLIRLAFARPIFLMQLLCLYGKFKRKASAPSAVSLIHNTNQKPKISKPPSLPNHKPRNISPPPPKGRSPVPKGRTAPVGLLPLNPAAPSLKKGKPRKKPERMEKTRNSPLQPIQIKLKKSKKQTTLPLERPKTKGLQKLTNAANRNFRKKPSTLVQERKKRIKKQAVIRELLSNRPKKRRKSHVFA